MAIDKESPQEDNSHYERLDTFKTYSIQTWLKNSAVYPRSLWSHYGSVMSSYSLFMSSIDSSQKPRSLPKLLWICRDFTRGLRTNNHVEGYHRRLNFKISTKHSEISTLISNLQDDEHEFKLQRRLLDMGHAVPQMRKKYRVSNQRLAGFKDQLKANEISLGQYVRRVAFALPEV